MGVQTTFAAAAVATAAGIVDNCAATNAAAANATVITDVAVVALAGNAPAAFVDAIDRADITVSRDFFATTCAMEIAAKVALDADQLGFTDATDSDMEITTEIINQ